MPVVLHLDTGVSLQRAISVDVVNLGFGTACNLGARNAPEELILFLNPDARLCDGALAALRDAARAYPDAVAFNPLIVKEDGSYLLRGRCNECR